MPSPILAPRTSIRVARGRLCRIIYGARTSPTYQIRLSAHTKTKYGFPGADMSLSGSVAVVAGASGDIGRAIAFDLLKGDADVFMLGRNIERLLHPQPPPSARERCRLVVADLTEDGAVDRIAAEVS